MSLKTRGVGRESENGKNPVRTQERRAVPVTDGEVQKGGFVVIQKMLRGISNHRGFRFVLELPTLTA